MSLREFFTKSRRPDKEKFFIVKVFQQQYCHICVSLSELSSGVEVNGSQRGTKSNGPFIMVFLF